MNAAISTALSGMTANMLRLRNSASNVANAQTRGTIPSSPPSQPVPASGSGQQVYQAVRTQLTATPNGGVAASSTPTLPSYLIEYDPTAPYANEQGLVAAPNVDLAREAVEQIVAEHSYKANIATIRTAAEMERSLLDLKA
jgi:flagellar basal-body rod protein FlgC